MTVKTKVEQVKSYFRFSCEKNLSVYRLVVAIEKPSETPKKHKTKHVVWDPEGVWDPTFSKETSEPISMQERKKNDM